MGNTNSVALRAVKQSSPTAIPASPKFQSLCHTGVDLRGEPQTTRSERICGGGSRGIKDLTLLGVDPAGGFNFEYYFGGFSMIMESLFQSTWNLTSRRINTAASDNVTRPASNEITAVTASGTTFTVASDATADFGANFLLYGKGFTNAGNNGLHIITDTPSTTTIECSGSSLVDETPPATAELHVVGYRGATGDIDATTSGGNALTSTSLNFTTLGLAVGQWIKVGGATTSSYFGTQTQNNGFCRISLIEANRLSFDVVPTGWATEASTLDDIQIFWGDYIRDASTPVQYAYEVAHTDLSSPVYEYFIGEEIDSFRFGGPAKSNVTGTIVLSGRTAQAPTTTRFASASTIDENGNDTYVTGALVGRIGEGGASLASPNFVIEATVEISNSLRKKEAWQNNGSVGIGAGDFLVSVNLNVFFENETLLAKVINNTETSFDVAFRDADGQVELWDLPRGKYSAGSTDKSQRNDDVKLPLTFEALYSSTLGYVCHHQRFFYAPASP